MQRFRLAEGQSGTMGFCKSVRSGTFAAVSTFFITSIGPWRNWPGELNENLISFLFLFLHSFFPLSSAADRRLRRYGVDQRDKDWGKEGTRTISQDW